MLEDIFYQGLDSQDRDLKIIQVRIQTIVDGDLVRIANPLQGKIIFQMLQFVAQRGGPDGQVHSIAHVLRQTFDHFCNLFVFLHLYHHTDRVQYIDNEMGLDLVLQVLQLDVF